MSVFLDVIIFVMFIVFIVWGYKKGIMKVAVSLIFLIIVFVLSSYFSNILSNFIYDFFIKPNMLEKVNTLIIHDASESISDKTSNILSLFPSFISNSFNEYGITSEAINNQLSNGSDVAANNIIDLVKPVFINFIRWISMTVLITCSMFFSKFFINRICKIFKLPVLNLLNSVLGAAFGFIKSIIIILIIIFLIRLIMPMISKDSPVIFSENNIQQTFLFKIFYHNNFYEDIFNVIDRR